MMVRGSRRLAVALLAVGQLHLVTAQGTQGQASGVRRGGGPPDFALLRSAPYSRPFNRVGRQTSEAIHLLAESASDAGLSRRQAASPHGLAGDFAAKGAAEASQRKDGANADAAKANVTFGSFLEDAVAHAAAEATQQEEFATAEFTKVQVTDDRMSDKSATHDSAEASLHKDSLGPGVSVNKNMSLKVQMEGKTAAALTGKTFHYAEFTDNTCTTQKGNTFRGPAGAGGAIVKLSDVAAIYAREIRDQFGDKTLEANCDSAYKLILGDKSLGSIAGGCLYSVLGTGTHAKWWCE